MPSPFTPLSPRGSPAEALDRSGVGPRLRDLAREHAEPIIGLGINVLFVAGVLWIRNYGDIPGPFESLSFGREKNALSSVITGLVAHEIAPKSEIHFQITKPLWPDAKLTGSSTSNGIATEVDLSFGSVKFVVKRDSVGSMHGEVEKSGLDWQARALSAGTWEIERWGPKFDRTLTLNVKDGRIQGTFDRPWAFDWKIQGSYDQHGNVNLEVSCPLQGDFGLQGSVAASQP